MQINTAWSFGHQLDENLVLVEADTKSNLTYQIQDSGTSTSR